MPNVEIFDLWRWMLSVTVTIYVVIYTVRTLLSYVLWFNSSQRYQVMGHYAVVLLLRARVRQFARELVWIGLLLAALATAIVLHWMLIKVD